MKVKDFVEVYKNAANVKEYCKKRVIVDKYISYEEKIAFCQNIVTKTCYFKKDDDILEFKQSTPIRFMLFHMNMINLYTDIEIDFEHIFEEFNLMDRVGAIELIIGAISEVCPHELATFNTLLKMTVDDEFANKRDLVSWLEGRIDNMKYLLGIFDKLDLTKLSEEIKENA